MTDLHPVDSEQKLYQVSPSPHVRSSSTTQTIMLDVLIALSPLLLWACYVFGLRALTVTLIRFVCSFLSGVLLWGSYAPEGMNVWVYSLTYNASYMIPNAALTTALIIVMCLAVDPTTLRPMKRKEA